MNAPRRWLAGALRAMAARLAPAQHACLEDDYHAALLESMDRANALDGENARLRNALSEQALAFEETTAQLRATLDETNTIAGDAVDTLRREGIPFLEAEAHDAE